jgi:uncharacterized protein (DUF4415 family)
VDPAAADVIQVTRSQAMETTLSPEWTEDALLEADANNVEPTLGGPRGPVYVQLDNDSVDSLLESGLMTEAETLAFTSSSSVLPTLLFRP